MGEAGTCSILWLGDALAQDAALVGHPQPVGRPAPGATWVLPAGISLAVAAWAAVAG
jgi:hypothetical protein